MLAALQGSRMLLLNSNGCEGAGVGINDNFIDVSSDIFVFPNPTSGDVWVDYNFAQYENGQVDIVNMFGQVIGTVPSETIGSSMNFDLRDQPAGVYFVSFKSEGVAGTKKIILEK